jgi:sugar phosphate isomerase/epimerase
MIHKQIGSTIYQFHTGRIASDAQMLYYDGDRPAKEEFERLMTDHKIKFKIDNDWVRIADKIVELAEKTGVKLTQEPYTKRDATLNAFARALVMECVDQCISTAKYLEENIENSYEASNMSRENARLIKLRFNIEDDEDD